MDFWPEVIPGVLEADVAVRVADVDLVAPGALDGDFGALGAEPDALLLPALPSRTAPGTVLRRASSDPPLPLLYVLPDV